MASARSASLPAPLTCFCHVPGLTAASCPYQAQNTVKEFTSKKKGLRYDLEELGVELQKQKKEHSKGVRAHGSQWALLKGGVGRGSELVPSE